MKRSDIEKQIEEIITEILGEVDIDKTAGAVQVKKGTPQSSPAEIKKLTSQGVDVTIIPEGEEEDKEPSKAELKKSASAAKVKDALVKVTKEMKTLASKFKEAEGNKKEKIKDDLKKLTATKKDLEKKLDKSL
jgi:hypothetical protein